MRYYETREGKRYFTTEGKEVHDRLLDIEAEAIERSKVGLMTFLSWLVVGLLVIVAGGWWAIEKAISVFGASSAVAWCICGAVLLAVFALGVLWFRCFTWFAGSLSRPIARLWEEHPDFPEESWDEILGRSNPDEETPATAIERFLPDEPTREFRTKPREVTCT